jgi:hypothetical protein
MSDVERRARSIALYGARRADWRTPLLALIGLQYLLHAISHLVDVGDADRRGQGWSRSSPR